MSSQRPVYLLAVLLMLLAACSGPRGGREATPEEPTETLPSPAEVTLAEYEDFDAGPYTETPPEAPDVSHDVPQRLMDGRAPTGTTRTVQGFRIQISSSLNKDEAVRLEEEAKAWWRGREEKDAVLPTELPVYVVYRQPYYRVRIGNFASRTDARRALSAIEEQFPGALIVPDTVVLRN